jgi:tripartite ATP-independent transporter DctM subunit
MSFGVALAILAVALAILIGSGFWTALALLGSGALIIALQSGDIGLSGIGTLAFNSTDNFLLSAVPMFVLMGQILLACGVGEQFFAGVAALMRRVPGELLPASILACGVFAATTGTSVATAAAVGAVAVPEMKRRGYNSSFAAGTIAAGGTLGILVPPSIALIIYSSLENVSITKLFAAGVVPAIVMALLFIAYVMVRVLRNPALVRQSEARMAEVASMPPLDIALSVLPILLLIGLVLGSIYSGVATPTEAASLGVIGALIVCARRLSRDRLYHAARRTVEITAMVFAIILGGQVVSFALVNSGIAQSLEHWVTANAITTVELLIAMCVIYLLLGDFVEGVGMMIITTPVVFPIFMQQGYDPVLLGVIIAILIELGQITPPVGLNLFVLRGFDPTLSQGQIIRAALPYAGIMIVALVATAVFPALALWLPAHVGAR